MQSSSLGEYTPVQLSGKHLPVPGIRISFYDVVARIEHVRVDLRVLGQNS